MDKKKRSLEDELYIWGVIALGLIAAAALFLFFVDTREVKLPDCTLYSVFGVYCPGCGGTRAVRSLLHGHIIKALWYHPFVVYGAVIYVIYMGSHTIKRYIYKGFPAMKYRDTYLYIWIAIMVLNWIVKNILLIKFGIGMN